MDREVDPIMVRIDGSNPTDIGMLVASVADFKEPSASPYMVIEGGWQKPCCVVVYALHNRVLYPHLHVKQEDLHVFSISLADFLDNQLVEKVRQELQETFGLID